MKITIRVFRQDQEVSEHVLGEGVHRAGRSSLCDIPLSSDAVERSQLEIRITPTNLYLTNMGAAGGVRVNGEFRETAELRDGDELRAGPFRLIVLQGDWARKPAADEVREPSQASQPSHSIGGGKSETVVESTPLLMKLVFLEGPRAGEESQWDCAEVTFGRSKKADVFLDDKKLSRIHAKITRWGMGYRLVDFDSRNGTFVNGLRVLEHPLESFDEIQIGESKMRFLVHDVALAALRARPDSLTVARSDDKTQSLAEELPALLAPTPRFFYQELSFSRRAQIASAVVVTALFALLLVPHTPRPAVPVVQAPPRLPPVKVLPAPAPQKVEDNPARDLELYLSEGKEYLHEGDWQRADESFNAALLIDPDNATAVKGMKAAQLKVSDIQNLPPPRDLEAEKQQEVTRLFGEAWDALSHKAYQRAINTAQKIRQIELKGQTKYLNLARQIVDRAHLSQKEEFEPFIALATDKYATGDFMASRDLCEQMLREDKAYEPAQECVANARERLTQLAKEAYVRGYILASLGKLADAHQEYLRARQFVQPGDEYYDRVQRELKKYP